MTGKRIGRETLEEQLPAILREQYQLDGLPRDHEPSWEYITANTRYSAQGLNDRCKELYDQTLIEFLRDRGFGVRSNGEWPTDDEETIRSLQYYIESAEDRKGWSEATIDSVRSAINKAYEAIRNEGLDTELLNMGHYKSEQERVENIQHVITIIEYMDRDLADSTMGNYPRYFKEYYDIVKNRYEVNLNPVDEALDEFEWYRRDSNPQPVTEDQLNDLWNALDALGECPVDDYDLEQWRMWMKVLIVFLIAVGPRSSEVERINVRTHLHFGDDPHVHYVERKNIRRDEGPSKVPIMMGGDFLQSYCAYIDAVDGNGKLVPSDQSASGCRTPGTLNDWLARLCKIADVRLDDGTFPTIQNFRQFWKTLYSRALVENRKHIKFVAKEDDKAGPRSDETDYIPNEVNRQHIREIGRKYFDAVLELGELPELVREELDQDVYSEGQSKIPDFAT